MFGSSQCVRKAVGWTPDAEAAGADAAFCAVPYYNKPTQAGMYVP